VSPDIWAERLDMLARPAWTTLTVGIAAAAIALVLVAGCLENEARRQRSAGRGALMMVYLPLLVPQIGFLFGVQVLLVASRMDGTWAALVWAHLLFVLPYVFLALADPYRSLDPRYARSALALGRSPFAVWLRIKLPLLLRPVLVASAVGFAVSVAQYLPTVFAGGGRLSTLTTEAVSLAAGGDRRTVGMFAFTLAALPLFGFAVAIGAPAWRFRHRRAMQVGA
jgi:putative thiamine transport system permease protein